LPIAAVRFGRSLIGLRGRRRNHPAALRALLDTFGVVVIPDGMGGFVHNAAIHLVDEEGRLGAIYDLGEERAVLAALGRAP
jgi:protein SCO1/2